MANDESNATKVEDWIIAQIKGMTEGGSPVFDPLEVTPFDGTDQGKIEAFADELFSGTRDMVCRVLYQSDRAEPLEEGAVRMVPTFLILVGIRNRRPDAARRGDGTTIGTNRLRDLLRYALHDKQPSDEGGVINDGVTSIEMVMFRGSRVVLNKKNQCIQQTVIEVKEAPWADA